MKRIWANARRISARKHVRTYARTATALFEGQGNEPLEIYVRRSQSEPDGQTKRGS